MSHGLSFTSTTLNARDEYRDATNPFYGQSLLLWLQDHVDDTVKIQPPENDAHGWHSHAVWQGHEYLISANATPLDDRNWRWQLNFEPSSTLMQKLFGKVSSKNDEELINYIANMLANETDFKSITRH